MKTLKTALSLVLSLTLISSAFSVFAALPSGSDLTGFDEQGYKAFDSRFNLTANDDERSIFVDGKKQINVGCNVSGYVGIFNEKTDKYDVKTSGYIREQSNLDQICDKKNQFVEICDMNAFLEDSWDFYNNGETVADIVFKLDSTYSVNAFLITHVSKTPSLRTGWYSVYAGMTLNDLNSENSKIYEFKNVKNCSKQLVEISDTAEKELYANYVKLRVYFPIDYGYINQPGSIRLQDYGHLRICEFAIYGVKHNHSYEQTAYTAPTCKAAGSKTEVCSVCKNVQTTKLNMLPHSNKTTTTAATYFAAGKKVAKCTVCGKTVTTKLAKKILKKPTAKLTAAKKALKVKVNKVTGQTGFQIRYRLKGKSKWTVKTYTGKKTVTKKIKLKAKKNYQVGVRAMVKSGSKKAYSSWSKTYTKKTK